MFVCYNNKTFRTFSDPSGYFCVTKMFKSVAAAKAAITRRNKKWPAVNHSTYSVASVEDFRKIEPMVESVNIMSGTTFKEPLNTPGFLSPANETYWCM